MSTSANSGNGKLSVIFEVCVFYFLMCVVCACVVEKKMVVETKKLQRKITDPTLYFGHQNLKLILKVSLKSNTFITNILKYHKNSYNISQDFSQSW